MLLCRNRQAYDWPEPAIAGRRHSGERSDCRALVDGAVRDGQFPGADAYQRRYLQGDLSRQPCGPQTTAYGSNADIQVGVRR